MKYIALILLMAGMAWADTDDWTSRGSDYDFKTGTSQTWERQWDGGVKVEGTNYRTGTTWENEVSPRSQINDNNASGYYESVDGETGERHRRNVGTCVGWGSEKTCF